VRGTAFEPGGWPSVYLLAAHLILRMHRLPPAPQLRRKKRPAELRWKERRPGLAVEGAPRGIAVGAPAFMRGKERFSAPEISFDCDLAL
jgi:hypothetical protein